MNNAQVAAGRRALFPVKDRVKLTIERGEDTAYLIPYLISDPDQTGAAVMVVNNVTPEDEITRQLNQSIRALLG